MKVKGTAVLDLVKLVRSNKTLGWKEYLTDEDWTIINSDISASTWYQDEFFFRLSRAVFKIVGQSNLDNSFAFGRVAARSLAEVYGRLCLRAGRNVRRQERQV